MSYSNRDMDYPSQRSLENTVLGLKNDDVTMLEATRKKLREADFFLRLFAEQQSRIFRPDSEACDFYLSGFLSAARSVGDVIKAEEGKRYTVWWDQRKTTLIAEEQELLKFTNYQRTQSVHVRGPEVEVDSIDVPIAELQRELEARGSSIEIFPGGVPGAPALMPTVQKITLVFPHSSPANVYELSRRYLEFITSIISEYELSTLPPNVLNPLPLRAALDSPGED